MSSNISLIQERSLFATRRNLGPPNDLQVIALAQVKVSTLS